MEKFIASFSLKVKPNENDKFICINSNREILLDSVNSSFLHDVNEHSLVDPIQIFTHGDNSIFLIKSNDIASNHIFLKKKFILSKELPIENHDLPDQNVHKMQYLNI